MLLSDRDIRQAIQNGELVIDPFNDDHVQPASVDLTLDKQLKIFSEASIRTGWAHTFTLEAPPLVVVETPISLQPNGLVLASTHEIITLPSHFSGRLMGKSSLGRMGLSIHITAGFVDPGFHGQLTLELKNEATWPIKLYGGMKICQIAFWLLLHPAEFPYGSERLKSHYQHQVGPTEAR